MHSPAAVRHRGNVLGKTAHLRFAGLVMFGDDRFGVRDDLRDAFGVDGSACARRVYLRFVRFALPPSRLVSFQS
jgi:hypothetical protein